MFQITYWVSIAKLEIAAKAYPDQSADTSKSVSDQVMVVESWHLRSAIDLEKAAANAASVPTPAGILKNNGADLGEKEVAGLLAAWRRSRAERSTAYLTASLEYQPTAFSPKDMTYNDSILMMCTQVARLCNVPAYYISAEMNNSLTYSN